MTPSDLLFTLECVRSRGTGKWSAKCPAHPDRSPSLSIAEGQKGLLLKCWAGCTLQEITGALGLRVADLFSDAPLAKSQRAISQTPRIDPRALAFRLELYALDLRLRAELVLSTLKGFGEMTVSEDDRDRLMSVVASAYRDQERARLFEQITDSLRWKTFQEREGRNAA
jgi:hypothetical protein